MSRPLTRLSRQHKLTIGPLSPEQVEAAVKRLELEAGGDGKQSTFKNGRTCTICTSELRPAVNRRLLLGHFFWSIEKDYRFTPNFVRWHYEEHLLPSMEIEFSLSLMNLTARLEAYRLFPISASEYRQMEWCLGQFMVARKVLMDAIASENILLTDFRRKVLNDYIGVVGRIRDTIVLLHNASRKKRPPEKEGLEDSIPEEQKKVLEDARKKRQEATHDSKRTGSVG